MKPRIGAITKRMITPMTERLIHLRADDFGGFLDLALGLVPGRGRDCDTLRAPLAVRAGRAPRAPPAPVRFPGPFPDVT